MNSNGDVVPDDDWELTKPPPLPGWGTSLASKEAAVGRLLHRSVTAVVWSSPSYGVSELPLTMLGADPRSPALSGVIRLTEGRLPRSPNEVLVTSRGLREGVPGTGPITLAFGKTKTSFTVVGRADAQLLGAYDLIGYPQPAHDELSFLVPGDQPVTWDDATRLARYGFTTTSLAIVAHPPRPLPTSGPGFGIGDATLVVGLLQVALLVGPAFAIGAARQRRSLALAALNGADPRQLRRVSLGQALLLGSTAALVGTLVGTGAGIASWPVWTSGATEAQGPLDVPIGTLALLLILGTLTALGSALVTARGLGRLSLVGALSGTVRSAPTRRRGAVAGILLLGIGLAGAWWPLTRMTDHSSQIGLVWLSGCVAALAGFLLVTPALLGLLARLGRHTPVVLRMTLRDLARHRGRATAIVASIAGGVLLLTVAWTLLASSEADQARSYVADALSGRAVVTAGTGTEASLDGLEAKVRSIVGCAPPGSRASPSRSRDRTATCSTWPCCGRAVPRPTCASPTWSGLVAGRWSPIRTSGCWWRTKPTWSGFSVWTPPRPTPWPTAGYW
ncbi:MAG: hypothetical protein QM695_06530 [Micropruina sp.]